MDNCIFCQIAQKKMATKLEYEDGDIVAFNDIAPKAPVHILIVPKKHLESVAEATEEDAEILGKMILVAKKIAQEKGISEKGYRLIFNTGPNSGQIVDHIHLHLLGGQKLGGMV